MKKIVITIIAVLILLGLIIQTGCKNKTGSSTGGGSSSTAQAKEIYYCPMHPDQTSDKPGKCPICGMDLVKNEAEQPAAETNKP